MVFVKDANGKKVICPWCNEWPLEIREQYESGNLPTGGDGGGGYLAGCSGCFTTNCPNTTGTFATPNDANLYSANYVKEMDKLVGIAI